MRFLIDNQLPLRLAEHLRRRGHDCSHVLDLGMEEADDAEVWALAAKEGRVLVSKDEDFINLASRSGDSGRLLWVRLGNCRNEALMAAIDRVYDDVVHAFESGQQVVELR